MEDSTLFLKALGERIVTLRKQKGLKQIELANRSGMDSATLRKVEKGRVNPTIWTLHRLCQTLDITLAELLDF